MTLNFRNSLHRAGIVVTLVSLAGYIFFFIAKGPRDKASIYLTLCLVAGSFLSAFTANHQKKKIKQGQPGLLPADNKGMKELL